MGDTTRPKVLDRIKEILGAEPILELGASFSYTWSHGEEDIVYHMADGTEVRLHNDYHPDMNGHLPIHEEGGTPTQEGQDTCRWCGRAFL